MDFLLLDIAMMDLMVLDCMLMDFIILELFIYLKLRMALCDFLHQRVPGIWQLFYLTCVLALQIRRGNTEKLMWHILEAFILSLPLLLLWLKGSLGGADWKHCWVEIIVHGALLTYLSLSFSILSLGFWHCLKWGRYKWKTQRARRLKFICTSMKPDSHYPLLPLWIMSMFFLAF